MRTDEQAEDKKPQYHCSYHGNIGPQVMKIGIFDDKGNFITNTFCGLCHFNMLQKNCCSAKLIGENENEEENEITE